MPNIIMSDNPLCKFCQKQTVYVPLVIGSASHIHQMEVYYCYDCQAEYVDWSNINSTHLYTTINNRMYRWSVELDGTMARLWYVGQPGVPGKRPNKELQLIKNFKDIYPKINPQNIQEKLRFILLFL